MRACTKCGTEYPRTTEYFAKQSGSRDGMRSLCRPCHRAASREHRQKTLEESRRRARDWQREHRDERKEYMRSYCRENAERLAERSAARHRANKEKMVAKAKEWAAQNPERRREISRAYNRRARRDPMVRLNDRIRSRIRSSLLSVGARKGGRQWEALLGYTAENLRIHIERQFKKGMTWANMGEWHIDHIIPLSSFTFTGPDDTEFMRAWAMTNLQPLWSTENQRKHAQRLTLL